MELFIHPDLVAEDIAGKGRGIRAAKNLPAGACIERSAVIVMNARSRQLLDQTLLHDYIFEWPALEAGACCVALGYLSLYNHARPSNCEYLMDYGTATMSIHTMRDIEAGEELSINYNGDFDNDSPVWFEMR
jgi:SET domain-containing protein